MLPTGRTRDLRALVDCGSTDNFINLKLAGELKLDVLPLKNGCVSLGADTTGEMRPITMTLGPSCSHRCKSTVIELGDHDVVLGGPFLSHMAARETSFLLHHLPSTSLNIS